MVLALVEFDDDWPYQLSRWALCAGAAWSATQGAGWRRVGFAIMAVIYNPIAPISFDDEWWIVNVLTAVFLCICTAGARLAALQSGLKAVWNEVRAFDWGIVAGSAFFLVVLISFIASPFLEGSKKQTSTDFKPLIKLPPSTYWNEQKQAEAAVLREKILKKIEESKNKPSHAEERGNDQLEGLPTLKALPLDD